MALCELSLGNLRFRFFHWSFVNLSEMHHHRNKFYYFHQLLLLYYLIHEIQVLKFINYNNTIIKCCSPQKWGAPELNCFLSLEITIEHFKVRIWWHLEHIFYHIFVWYLIYICFVFMVSGKKSNLSTCNKRPYKIDSLVRCSFI